MFLFKSDCDADGKMNFLRYARIVRCFNFNFNFSFDSQAIASIDPACAKVTAEKKKSSQENSGFMSFQMTLIWEKKPNCRNI